MLDLHVMSDEKKKSVGARDGKEERRERRREREAIESK